MRGYRQEASLTPTDQHPTDRDAFEPAWEPGKLGAGIAWRTSDGELHYDMSSRPYGHSDLLNHHGLSPDPGVILFATIRMAA